MATPVRCVHLHVHSHFSLLDGNPTIPGLVAAAKDAGMDALALTDHGNLYGAVEFMREAKAAGIKPIPGIEAYVARKSRKEKSGGDSGNFTDHLTLLAASKEGWQNLMKLTSYSYVEGFYRKPRIDKELLASHSKGLIALSGCLSGEVARAVQHADRKDAIAAARRWQEIFEPGSFYLEVMNNGLERQDLVRAALRDIATETGLPIVGTSDVHYLKRDDARAQEVMLAINTGNTMQDTDRMRMETDRFHFRTGDEMAEAFADTPGALERTCEIADRCGFQLKLGEMHLPTFVTPDGSSPDQYFRTLCEAGVRRRYPVIDEKVRARLEREIEVITQMGFVSYFLIVSDFIRYAREAGVPVGPGRGSAAGSMVAYCLGITNVDPLRYDLLFERFLNSSRVSMPDIDVDFAQDRREEVIAHVRDKYGAPLVAQIITYGKLQAKAALKDVARVCDLSFNDSDRITKLVPEVLNITIDDALKQEAKLRHLQTTEPRTSRVIALARSIEGAVRQTGVHAAGVVIADRPLVQITPLYRDGPEGGPVVQYDMKSAESIGLIKFDFLGLKTLDQVRDAVDMVERNTGQKVDIARVDEDDPATWALLQRGDTFGVFQVEGEGIRGMLTKLRPASLEDLVAAVALYRPGPLSSGMVDDFIDRKHGRKLVEYAFPELEPILSSTYGTIVYQEQVMQCAQVLAGYSLGEADLLRRAMGKKDAVEMGRQKTRFVNGAVAAGHNEQKASDLFDLLAKFAEYGFNKSHSAAYGFVAFQTAWLKANHRAEYMAALMSIDAGNSDKVLVYVGDCRRASIKILPPDVNASLGRFDVPREDRRSIRFGLHAVKGVGEGAVEAIVVARAGGRFTDLMDLLRRVDAKKANKKVWESLIKSGSLDSFGEPRARLAAALEDAMAAASEEQAQKASGQTSLFGGAAVQRPAFRMPTVGEWTVGERMKAEKEALGLFLTGHPVSAFAAEIERLGFKRVGDVPLLPISERKFGRAEDAKGDGAVSICAIVVSKRVIRNKNGDPMCFVTFEDMDGTVDGTLFADVLARSQAALDSGRPLAVRARVEQREGKPRGLRVLGLELMEDLRERVVSKVEIRLRSGELTDDSLAKLRELVAQSTGECRTKILVNGEGYAATLRVGRRFSVRATPKFVDGVRSLFGRTDALVLEE